MQGKKIYSLSFVDHLGGKLTFATVCTKVRNAQHAEVGDRRVIMDFSTFTGTQILAIWGAVTGSIGTVTGILGLWLRFCHQKRDQAHLKCEVDFSFEVTNGIPNPKYKIIIRCVGRRPLTLDAIEYSYNPPDLKNRLFRRRLWRDGKYCNKDDLGRLKPVSLSEGQKVDFLIEKERLTHLGKVAKVCVIDQTGKRWPVKWPKSRELDEKTQYGELDRVEEENPRRNCKIVGYHIQGDFYIHAHWNKEPLNKSVFMCRDFHFSRKDAYREKLEELRIFQLPKLLSGEIMEIT